MNKEEQIKNLSSAVMAYIRQSKERGEEIEKLKKENDEMKSMIEWFSKRDGSSKIQLCYDDGKNPFARRMLKVVDFGVSDNIYVVEDIETQKDRR